MKIATLSVDQLAQHCADDTQKFYRRQPHDTRYCFELMRRALADDLAEGFARVYTIYEPQVLRWVRAHSRFYQTGESADYFSSYALSNFYFALRGERFSRFSMLPQILSYLKLCVHTAIIQYLRDQKPAAPLDDASGVGHTPNFETRIHAAEVWQRICAVLPDEDDQLLARCVFALALKPAEIVEAYPQRWATARDVSVALQRIRRRLRSDPELQARNV